jgi:hypothetical protein
MSVFKTVTTFALTNSLVGITLSITDPVSQHLSAALLGMLMAPVDVIILKMTIRITSFALNIQREDKVLNAHGLATLP